MTTTPAPERGTPRTDAQAPVTIHDKNGIPYTSDLVDADFARQLERELQQAEADNHRLSVRHGELEGALQKMVDNACAACEMDDKGRWVVPVTNREWRAHCEATENARQLLSTPVGHGEQGEE